MESGGYEAKKTLCIFMAPDGNIVGQFRKLKQLARYWVEKSKASKPT
jgi:hypothetical protein